MPKIEKIERGGVGGGAVKSAEDYRNSYAVKALTDIETLKMLADLPVLDEKHDDGVTFTLSELVALGYGGKTTGAPMQFFNRIFDTLEVPYDAGTISRDNLRVKVIRYGNEFDFRKYSTTRAGNPSYATEVVNGKRVYKLVDGKRVRVGIIDHEDSPPGLVEALHNWLEDIAGDEDYEDIIIKMGLDKKMSELGLIEVEETVEEVEKVEE